MAHGGDIYKNSIEHDFSVNINPLGMPDGVIKVLSESIKACEQYPDIKARKLREKLSRRLGVDPQDIIFGNGASELIMTAVRAVKPKKILVPVPSFTGYMYAAKSCGCLTEFYYMREADGFVLTDGFLEHINPETYMVFLANPNNPTGKYIKSELLEKIINKCDKCNAAVVLDECFAELSDNAEESMTNCYKDFPNLLILRSFTKSFAIPGLRLGYAISTSSDLVRRMEMQIPEWSVSVPAQLAGIAALEETEYLQKARKIIKEQREYLEKELDALGFSCVRSSADYILFKDKKERKINLYDELIKKKILIRNCSDYEGLPDGWYRIAVKTADENSILIKALSEIVGK